MNRVNYVIDKSGVYLGLRPSNNPRVISRESFSGCIEEIDIFTGNKTIRCPSEGRMESHRFISNNGYVSK